MKCRSGFDPEVALSYAYTVRFTKMQALGNDYLFLDAFVEPEIAHHPDPHTLARAICDRFRGVGADGIIILTPAPHPERADLRMRIINSDGSDGGICGNGTRCLAKYIAERDILPGDGPFRVDSGPRVLTIEAHRNEQGQIDSATADMGPPVFDLARVPVDSSLLRPLAPHMDGSAAEYMVDHRTASFVSMGNPHMVCFIEEPVETIDLASEGRHFEHHPAFPHRINVHFVNVLSRSELRMRPWERGAGATLACASGACAVVAAGVALRRLDPQVIVRMPGGDLDIRVDITNGHISMKGEAVEVFSGEWKT